MFFRCTSINNWFRCYISMIAMLLVVSRPLCRHSELFLSLHATLQSICCYSQIIYFTDRFTSSCFFAGFQAISVTGRFAASYFVTLSSKLFLSLISSPQAVVNLSYFLG